MSSPIQKRALAIQKQIILHLLYKKKALDIQKCRHLLYKKHALAIQKQQSGICYTKCAKTFAIQK